MIKKIAVIFLFCFTSIFAEEDKYNSYVQPGMSDLCTEEDFYDGQDTVTQLDIEQLDFGFIYNSFSFDGHIERKTSAGPIFGSIKFEDRGTFHAFRPFYSRSYNAQNGKVVRDFLWPIGSIKEFNDQSLSRFLLYFNLDFDTLNPYSAYSSSVFPLLFWGRNREESSYFAFFPFGGSIDNFLGIDEIDFIMFPVYLRLKTLEMCSTDVLWPVFNYTSGPGIKRYRFWPFYGMNLNEGTWKKHFVLWPIWTDVRYYEEGAKGYGFILFPLFGHMKTQNQSTTWLIPPLFRFTDSEVQKMVYCPWPFFQYMRGEWDKLYFWPIWGTKERAGIRRDFYLWPFMFRRYTQRPRMTLASFTFIPLFYYENRCEVERKIDSEFNMKTLQLYKLDYKRYPVVKSESKSKYVKLWPLFSYRRLYDNSAFRVLDLWPGRSWPALERNYAPFWTIYSHYNLDNARADTLLWGLWRYKSVEDYSSTSLFPIYNQVRGKDSFKFNILYGLIGYDRVEENKKLKLLYFIKIPFGKDTE